MNIDSFNQLSTSDLQEALLQCCGSVTWINRMLGSTPFENKQQLIDLANKHWSTLNNSDYLQAFEAHPKIGDINSLNNKFTSTKDIARQEQSGINAASKTTLLQLSEKNLEYHTKYSYIFIVCASGKSAEQMLQILESRLANSPEDEIEIAAEEQRKITEIRLDKLID